ncbi:MULTISPECIES: Ig-like domain-containing protein [unclassified Rhizobacter]|uniref:Ig-like domain-containing protein n=1 Tax=unclassified Rhizobacter TaxID=2640088 RepID=UPI0006FF63EA|nr:MULTISPECIES: Ig-like domain-containing protein [unclassified Rhizobacter]KQU75606.1 hypothetical protein ASC88_24915 [Rhizobacter sp. Root29]KQW06814.1 hypothetical protein ASC98_25545 [Rhizobacter sp. Root1238]KRB19064.1 hypothetical protein ASE08_07650 [Rhizobacter sp. Root16D2]
MTRTVSATRALPALLLTLLLVACGGGGGDSTNDNAQKPAPPDLSASSPSTADTQPPVVSASATVSTDAVVLAALATDNVGIASVSFLVDGSAIQTGSVQKSPSDGSYTSSLPIGLITSGTHSFVAVAVDAAGNSTTSAAAGFTVGNPVSAPGSNDTVPPTITAAVQGNFGLVKLTAIAKDETRLFGVDFMVDGKLTGSWASLHYISTDPADQYYVLFDTTTLSPGAHTVVARARDNANHATLAELVLNVDPAAGLAETEPNNTLATANAVASVQLPIYGTLKNETELVGSTKIVHTDSDYYKLTIPAGQTLTVRMLTPQHQFFSVSIVDANGDKLSGDAAWPSSGEVSVAYTNGAAARDVWIRLSSGPLDFETRDQYTLTLSLQ